MSFHISWLNETVGYGIIKKPTVLFRTLNSINEVQRNEETSMCHFDGSFIGKYDGLQFIAG